MRHHIWTCVSIFSLLCILSLDSNLRLSIIRDTPSQQVCISQPSFSFLSIVTSMRRLKLIQFCTILTWTHRCRCVQKGCALLPCACWTYQQSHLTSTTPTVNKWIDQDFLPEHYNTYLRTDVVSCQYDQEDHWAWHICSFVAHPTNWDSRVDEGESQECWRCKTWCWWALPSSPLSTPLSSGLDSSAVAPLEFETESSWSRMLLGESTDTDMEEGSFLPGQSWNHFHQWRATATTSQQLRSLHFHQRQWENTTFVYAFCGRALLCEWAVWWLPSHIALSRWSKISSRWWVIGCWSAGQLRQLGSSAIAAIPVELQMLTAWLWHLATLLCCPVRPSCSGGRTERSVWLIFLAQQETEQDLARI